MTTQYGPMVEIQGKSHVNVRAAIKSIIFQFLRLPIVNSLGAQAAKLLLRLTWLSPDFVYPYRGKVTASLGNEKGSFTMWSDGSDTISARLKSGGIDNYEPEVRPIFESLISNAEVFIDIGANTGFYSLVAWATNPNCRIHAIEPLPKAVRTLARSVQMNNARNIRIHQLAASNQTRDGSFFVPRAVRISTGGSEFRSQSEACDEIATRFIRVDDFVSELRLDKVDVIKVDTEYTEHLVIEGAHETLEKFRPSLLIEILNDPQAEQIQNLLQNRRYRFFQMRPNGIVPITRLTLGDARDTNCNFLFLPEEKVRSEWVHPRSI